MMATLAFQRGTRIAPKRSEKTSQKFYWIIKRAIKQFESWIVWLLDGLSFGLLGTWTAWFLNSLDRLSVGPLDSRVIRVSSRFSLSNLSLGQFEAPKSAGRGHVRGMNFGLIKFGSSYPMSYLRLSVQTSGSFKPFQFTGTAKNKTKTHKLLSRRRSLFRVAHDESIKLIAGFPLPASLCQLPFAGFSLPSVSVKVSLRSLTASSTWSSVSVVNWIMIVGYHCQLISWSRSNWY